MTPSIYSVPNSVRNNIFSVMIILLGWFGLWMLWPSVPLLPPRIPLNHTVVYRYLPRAVGTVGVTWSSVLIGLPNKVGFVNRVQKEDPRLKEYLKPKPMSVEYHDVFPGGGKEGIRRDDFMMWAKAGRPGPERYEPALTERPVFAEISMTPGDIYIELFGDIKKNGEGLTTIPLLKDAAALAAGRWVCVTLQIKTGDQGWVNHVFIESSSGISEVDQSILRALYAVRAVNGRGNLGGTVRVTIAGRNNR